jgi:hypothetical protein
MSIRRQTRAIGGGTTHLYIQHKDIDFAYHTWITAIAGHRNSLPAQQFPDDASRKVHNVATPSPSK